MINTARESKNKIERKEIVKEELNVRNQFYT
jgi:hypothetical protein